MPDEMRLWLLEPVDVLPTVNPWQPWYDKAFAFVVRAESEDEARGIATDSGGDEVREGRPWLDPKLSTCVGLSHGGDPGVIVRDFASA